MTLQRDDTHDPTRDLVLTRTINVPRERVWAAWTQPEHLVKWFAPAPWSTVACEMDLRPGGLFRTVMRSPDGQDYPNAGCFLEIVERERIVFTDALTQGYRPADVPFFTAVITMRDHDGGTEYSARAMHRDSATRDKHEQMGFYTGWGQALDQLVALMQR